MQSEARIALAYVPTVPRRKAIESKYKRSGVTSHLRSILPDLLAGWDMLAVSSSGLVATLSDQLFFTTEIPAVMGTGHLRSDLIQAIASGTLLSPLLLHARHLRRVDRTLAWSTVRRVGTLIALTLALIALTHPSSTLPLPWAAAWFVVAMPVLLAGRLLANLVLHWAAARFGGERVAVIGRGNEAEWLRRALRQAGPAGIDLVASERRNGSLDGAINDLLERGHRGELDRVILAQPGLPNARMQQIEHQLKKLQIEVASLFPLLGSGPARTGLVLADIPLFLIARRPQWGYGGLSKTVIDRCLASALLLWMVPLLVLVAAAIWIDSPGPILFRQRRHGVNGGEFEIFKFRTMIWQGQQVGSGMVQTRRSDRRITRVGALLRRSSLDEIPQLLNVLNGTMSLVGPRPHPTFMYTEERLGEDITPEYPHRHRVKPGITGWAQVNGLRGATETADQLRRRVEHDNFYIENWSPWFDLRILAMTPVSLLRHRNNAF